MRSLQRCRSQTPAPTAAASPQLRRRAQQAADVSADAGDVANRADLARA